MLIATRGSVARAALGADRAPRSRVRPHLVAHIVAGALAPIAGFGAIERTATQLRQHPQEPDPMEHGHDGNAGATGTDKEPTKEKVQVSATSA